MPRRGPVATVLYHGKPDHPGRGDVYPLTTASRFESFDVNARRSRGRTVVGHQRLVFGGGVCVRDDDGETKLTQCARVSVTCSTVGA